MTIYDAFISYSHAQDKPIAAALQMVVQTLGKPWYARRALRVFRDDTSLSATPHLWPSIERALNQSRFLILLGSREAAGSAWVAKEIEHWLGHRSIDTLLIGLVDGDLAWNGTAGDFVWSEATPLPVVLRGRFTTEPKWVDLRAFRAVGSRRDAKLVELAADFAATVRGMPKEDLLSQEVRQQRRALTLAWAAASSLLILAGVAGLLWRDAATQRDRAEYTLKAATQAANSLVLDVAVKLRQTSGIPIDLSRDILSRARGLQDQLIKYNETAADIRRSQAIALRESSQTWLLQGNTQSALNEATQSRAIIESLLMADPSNRDLQREMALSHNRVGEALSRAARNKEALEAFRRGLALRRDLADGTADNDLQRDLALSYERTGDELFSLNQRSDALDAYKKSSVIREQLVRADPNKTAWQGDLAVSYDRIGRMLEERPDEALAAYRESLAIREKLVDREPRFVFWRRDLAVSHDQVGTILLRSGKSDEALKAYRKGLEIREKLASDQPDIPLWQVNVAISLINLATANERPAERYTAALNILHRLEMDNKLSVNQQAWPKEIERRINLLAKE